ncbi:hypothetical protein BOTBODRAFT_183112 [Botryobasidium botryosum FD-172 SS1]|uniref:Uncharacterized protein n=1 Tax=Botryobasidium botryosum (strain FD-172 SS1) TaxID=930990 RepID=A0A067N233_BOTB1|nr:hypothetical protein BOTBODRAFT_183112 [Botryobasidium botryosum FD-172 SS1]
MFTNYKDWFIRSQLKDLRVVLRGLARLGDISPINDATFSAGEGSTDAGMIQIPGGTWRPFHFLHQSTGKAAGVGFIADYDNVPSAGIAMEQFGLVREYGLWKSHCWGQSPSSPGPASTARHCKAKHYLIDIATSSSPSPHRHLIVVVVVAALATVTITVTVVALPVRPPLLSRVYLAP